MKLSLKRKIVLVFVGVLAVVTVLDALLASYFTSRQNQDAAFATLKRDLLTWQDELQDTTLHMRAVALSAIGETVALNQLSALKALDYKLADALDKKQEVKEAARTLAFSKSVSLNRLHLVLRTGGFSAISVYIDGKLSHQVSVSEVGMFVQRSNGARVWVKAVADGNGNLPLRSWPAWEEGVPPPVAASLPSVDRPGVSFAYSSADNMLIEVAVPVEGIIDHSLQQGEGQPPELSVIDPRIAGSANNPAMLIAKLPSTPFAIVVFQKRIDQAFLQAVERKTGMWPLLFSPDGRYRRQLGPLNLSLQELLPNLAEASAGIKAQTVSTGQGSFYAAALPWQFEQQPGFVLALVASRDSSLQNIRQTVAAILTVTSLILALSIGVGIFWVGRFIDPIIALTNAVKAIGLVSRLERGRQSDYRLTTENLRPLAISAPGEIGDLAWAFDMMIAELQHSFDSLEQRVQERTVELLALQQVLEKQNLQLEKQSRDLSAGNRLLQEEITERKLAEDLLRLREQEFRSLAENSPDNIARYDLECRIKYMNSQLHATLGIADDAAWAYIGNTPSEMYPDGRFDAYQETIKNVVESGLEAEIELMLPDTGDGVRYHLVRMVAERDQRGEVMGVLIMGRDITERQEMEGALLRSRQTLTEAQRIAHIGSWELDHADNNLSWSDEIFRIFEIDRGQFGATYEAFLNAVHPYDRAAVERAFTESLYNREPCEIEHRLLMADGRVKYVLERYETAYADGGEPLYSLGTVQDITERKSAEDEIRALNASLELRVLDRTEELRQQTRYLRTMIDTLPMLAWLKDTDSRFLVVNQAFATACSHSVDNLIGRSDLDIWQREHAEAYRADDAEVMATCQLKVVEEPFVDAHDGAIWVETFRAPVVDEDGRVLGTVGVSRDISERKAVEAAREAALAEAERLARLRSEFMARMSHELRTPLNGILGYAQILLGENRLSEHQSAMLNVIQQSGEHLLNLINDILDFAKIEAGKQELSLSDVHLPRFLRNLADIVGVRAEQKQLAFVCDIAADVSEGIRADEMRLRQVLLNLLSNAVKYSERGQICLRVTVMEPGRLRFEVQDSGIGIESGQLETIFLPFEQAGDGQYHTGGTGLGLVICRELVKLMGSDIHVTSRIGEGSVFWFDLDVPVVDVYGEIIPVEQSVVGYQGPRRRVLVVDDVDVNRVLLIDMLNRLGFETVEAVNGRECLDRAKTLMPALILLDMLMPEMDGLETARRLRGVPGLGQTPIIAVSASASGIDVADAMNAGVNVFLSKPVDMKRLTGQIGGLLKLDWIYAQPEAESSPQHKPDEWLDAPPLKEMRVLHHLAQQGSMRDIIRQAEYLAKLDDRYRPFAERLRRLAKAYQSKAIMDLVERYLNRKHMT